MKTASYTSTKTATGGANAYAKNKGIRRRLQPNASMCILRAYA